MAVTDPLASPATEAEIRQVTRGLEVRCEIGAECPSLLTNIYGVTSIHFPNLPKRRGLLGEVAELGRWEKLFDR